MFETGYKVKPMSIKGIRGFTDMVRDVFQIAPKKPFPVLPFIENVLPEWVKGLTFAILEDKKFEGGVFADFNPVTKQLRCRESVYINAFNGEGASRGHLCHEMGHIFLHRNQAAVLARGCIGSSDHEKFEDSEWQATTFERELLIPFSQLSSGMTIQDIARLYQTSTKLAEVALDRYRRSLLQENKKGGENKFKKNT